MDKALLDSSTLFDVSRALRARGKAWAENTLENLVAYKNRYEFLSISGMTLFELLEGLHGQGNPIAVENFRSSVLPSYEVIQPNEQIESVAAEIHAVLRLRGQGIGVVDTIIAATAVVSDLTLVNANTRHFPRVVEAGFPLRLANWRDG